VSEGSAKSASGRRGARSHHARKQTQGRRDLGREGGREGWAGEKSTKLASGGREASSHHARKEAQGRRDLGREGGREGGI